MSLYYVQKLLYNLNRDPALQARFKGAPEDALQGYTLTEQERDAILQHDIGLLYVIGVNGQILMHFAALCGFVWVDFINAMRDGVREHGPVRAGVYAMTTGMDEKVAGI